jgi:hypothetical protein
MIYQGRASRRAMQVARSQLAVRLGIALYAALCAAIALRCAVLLVGAPGSVWTVKTILLVSTPIVFPLSLTPAAGRPILGSTTLADLTVAVLFLALPLLMIARRPRA